MAAGIVTTARIGAILILVGLALSSSSPGGRDAGTDLSPAPLAAPIFSQGFGEGVLVSRVCPNAPKDEEFVELVNLGPESVDLSGWSLSDREDTATFPAGTRIAAADRLVATRNATGYAEDVREAADFSYGIGEAPRMDGGTLRLGDAGDEVLLLDAVGAVRDAYVYGTSTYAGPGWTGRAAWAPARGEVATRRPSADGRMDHDRAEDWEGVRAYRLGQSDFEPPPVDVASVPRILLSPDDGRGPLLSFLASADRTLEVAVYTLTSRAIGSVLADRARDGVRVRVLLEGAPVGAIEEAERAIVDEILAAGAQVRFLCSSADAVKRYRYVHAKYAVVDGERLVVSSENFGDSGFPLPGDAGNRGWSAIVEDRTLAGQLWEVFEEDFDPSRPDSVAATPTGGGDAIPPVAVLPWSPTSPSGARRIQLVVGPDTTLSSRGPLGAIEAAVDRIWIEMFYADDPWGETPNVLLEAAVAAARRGVSVRILLDGSSWSSEAEVSGNGPLAGRLNDRAAQEGLDLEARTLVPQGSIERVHNKGMVIDGRVALISSLNWAHGSATENREIGLLLEDAEIAERLEAAFLADWTGRLPGTEADRMIDDPVVLIALYVFVAAASAASLRKLRRTDKGLKPQPGMVWRGLLGTHLGRRRRKVRVLSPELVAQSGDGAGGGGGDRGGGEEALRGLGGSQGNRGP